jgi:hypothetical protein
MTDASEPLQRYVLPSGSTGRERLRLLAAATEPGTMRLLGDPGRGVPGAALRSAERAGQTLGLTRMECW